MNALRSRITWARAVLVVLAALLVGLLAVFVAVGVSGPAWVYAFFGVQGGTEKFRILEFVGVGMGGVLLAIGATIAHRRAVAMEDAAKAQTKAAQAQAEAAAQQAAANRGAEDGRRQERLKNAIEHLGHESDSVRLGGALRALPSGAGHRGLASDGDGHPLRPHPPDDGGKRVSGKAQVEAVGRSPELVDSAVRARTRDIKRLPC